MFLSACRHKLRALFLVTLWLIIFEIFHISLHTYTIYGLNE